MKLRVKDFTTKVGSGVTPKGGAESYLSQGIPLFRSQNVVDNGFLLEDIAYISEEVDESMKGSRVKAGDVLLDITGASIGRCFFTSDDFERGNVNQHVCIIRPKRNIISPEFLHYNIISNVGKEYIRQSQTGANREGLTIEDIKNFSFEIPSISEQQRIVDYLDEKTKAIDARISILEKKSDAYIRLKASVINRAVTRGLNPNVTLKDSGIEWIGMIPEHWEVKRFKDIINNYTTGVTPPSKDDSFFDTGNGYTWVTIADLNQKRISESSLNLSQKAVDKYSPELTKEGSLMFSFKLSIGKLAFADKDLYTNEAILSIPPTNIVCLDYMFHYLPTVLVRNATENIYGAKMLNQKIIANMFLAVPPLSEQQSIATYLDTKCFEIDKAIDNIGKQIEALKRLKRSLINEVVTGKRKV